MTGSRLQQIFWIALVVKLVVAAILPLTSDEAYYWVWSQHPQLSYYDHPPAVAWLFWLGQWMSGLPGSVRWPGVVLGHAALGVWLRLLRPFLTERQRLYWLLLALLSPLFGGSNLLVTPDLPLMFFYALSLLLFLVWRERGGRLWALALGLSIGCGFSSKYVMLLFPLTLLPLLWVEPRLRGPTLRALPWIVLGTAVGSAPVWIWNLQNDFVSFKFQMSHGLGRKSWKPEWTAHYILGQIALLFPVVVYWALLARRRLPPVFSFMAWLPLGFFLCTTSHGYVEANWPIVAYPALFALAAAALPASRRGLNLTLGFWGTFLGALLTVILFNPGWARDIKFREFHQFDQLALAADGLEPLYARSYQMAAKLHFALQRPVYKLRGMNRRDFYDYLPESEPVAQSYYVAAEKEDQLPPAFLGLGHHIVQRTAVDEHYEIWRVEAR